MAANLPALPAGGQTLYRSGMRPAVAGMLADLTFMKDIISTSPGPQTAQVSVVTVAVATNAAVDTITINEIPINYTVGGGDTINSIASAMGALINADTILNKLIVAIVSANTISISSLIPGTAFSITVGSTHANDLTVATPTANQTTAPISFGMGVVAVPYGSAVNDHQIMLPNSSGSITGVPGFQGVALHLQIQQQLAYQNPQLATGLNQYQVNDSVPVLRKGPVWVPIETAVNPSLPVYLRFTQNGLLIPGNWRTDADGGKAQQLTTASWVSTATLAQGVGLLRLN